MAKGAAKDGGNVFSGRAVFVFALVLALTAVVVVVVDSLLVEKRGRGYGE